MKKTAISLISSVILASSAAFTVEIAAPPTPEETPAVETHLSSTDLPSGENLASMAPQTLPCGETTLRVTRDNGIAGAGHDANKQVALLEASNHIKATLIGTSGLFCEHCPIPDACFMTTDFQGGTWKTLFAEQEGDGDWNIIRSYTGAYSLTCTPCN